MKQERKTHWEDVYRTTAIEELGWYQAHPTLSLNLIQATGVQKTGSLIDVGGGDSTLVDHLLDQDFNHITVLDISDVALERAKARLGDRADLVTWIEADITDFRSSRTYDVWHDRAVFHFLTEAEDREKYCETMNRTVSAKGNVIIATFGYEAPPTCSGLPVVRYSPEFLTFAIRSNFVFIESFEELHMTPGGNKQPFIYCRFIRRKP
ncbi:class I SAM-dependent methyltransferase [Candidatus Nitrospira allomarina]|uniref:Class I SAM-dependent methyltransferase n=1 Tax=Candidatus Nitrospira allomarina TaxID=3020900 RepID=A0AA96JYH9_9BACT|nr:class I SAM-dependent methyltransferase [Candidatus Nitrospira allomarina]WNM57584.1 class I SAM-dependent methyltransferase [Candidatus Nitrospira allomarina]